MNTSGIILAGGQSRRMQTNKALIRLGKELMIQNIINTLQKSADEIIIVTNDPIDYLAFEAMLVTDLIPQHGPLSGIHAGLKAASGTYGFVVACDMPFLSAELISYMIEHIDGYDALIPRIGEYYQPLHAIYSKQCIQPIEKRLLAGNFKVSSFYDDINLKYITEQEIIPFAEINKLFFNINSPDDLQKAREMVGDDIGQTNK